MGVIFMIQIGYGKCVCDKILMMVLVFVDPTDML